MKKNLIRTGAPSAHLRVSSSRRLLVPFYIIGLLPLLSGCDDRPKRAAVSGTILIDGDPVTYGNVRFVPQDQRPSSGKLDEKGRFTLTCYDGNDGAVIGTHRVQVSTSELLASGTVWHAPRKYADFRKSGLVVEVSESVDDLVIELTWDGEKKPRKKKR